MKQANFTFLGVWVVPASALHQVLSELTEGLWYSWFAVSHVREYFLRWCCHRERGWTILLSPLLPLRLLVTFLKRESLQSSIWIYRMYVCMVPKCSTSSWVYRLYLPFQATFTRIYLLLISRGVGYFNRFVPRIEVEEQIFVSSTGRRNAVHRSVFTWFTTQKDGTVRHFNVSMID